MKLEEAILIIEEKIQQENKTGINNYSLSLDSQPTEQDDGSYKEQYRADCLYMITGE